MSKPIPRIARTRPALFAAAIVAALAAGTALVPLQVAAQAAWPNRPIKLIVPFAPGGSNDVLSRAIATKLAPRLGQPVVIENKGGAGGILGTDAATKSQPDGNTLLFTSTSIATNPASGQKLPYDTEKDLEPIGVIGATPLILFVSSDSKVKSLKEFVEQARAKPNGVSYGSGGVGSMSHLGMELFAADAKLRLAHIPYKGMSEAFNDIMGGHVQAGLSTVATTKHLIDGGKLRPLAVTSLQRSAFMPNLPTTAEAGVPGSPIEFWWGLLAPARTPPAIIKRLNEELNAILVQSDMRELLAREAVMPKPGTPEDLRKLISVELVQWTKLIKDANINLK